MFFELGEVLGLVVGAGVDVTHARGELVPDGGVEVLDVLLERLLQLRAQTVVVQVAPRKADDVRFRVEVAADVQLVQRRYELARAQVAGNTENDKGTGWGFFHTFLQEIRSFIVRSSFLKSL